MTRLVRLLELQTLRVFFVEGDWRVLNDPDGSPTARQLLRLNHAGLLAVVEPGQVEPLTRGEAAHAIATTNGAAA